MNSNKKDERKGFLTCFVVAMSISAGGENVEGDGKKMKIKKTLVCESKTCG